MSSKRWFVISLALVCISQILLFSFGYFNTSGGGVSSEEPPQNNPPEIPESPVFVVPESPIGTLGLTIALAAAFGVFAVVKKRKSSPNL